MREPSAGPGVATTGGRRLIGILCLSAIPDDPRVRRQGDLMTEAGWDVVAIGLPGHRSSDPAWTCLAVGASAATTGSPVADSGHVAAETSEAARTAPVNVPPGAAVSIEALTRALKRRAGSFLIGAAVARRTILGSALARRTIIASRAARMNVQPSYASAAYWTANHLFGEIHKLASAQQVDLWLANDWTTLPIAARLAAEQGVPFGYDTHELAIDEYAQSLKWRLLHQPLIRAAEGGAIRGAAFVTCVSDGIADRLQEVYGLPKRPIVIRNTPHYQPQDLRPVGDTIRVIYHGIVSPGRGLEATIRSVALWRPEFHLTIRGPVHAEYAASLKTIAHQAGVSDRVVLDPPVPMTELVARAAEFDVGLFALPDHSHQNVYVLPNKFFEYTMAGLALCVSDLPEMTRLLRQHDLGVLIEAVTPEAIAKAVNSLDRTGIMQFKAHSLEAAKSLNWSSEGRRFADLSADALRRDR